MDHKNYFNTIEHPSDIGLEVVGDSPEKIFELAALGMFSIMCDTKKIIATSAKNINIIKDGSFGIEDMLILWLEKLIYYFEVNSMLFSRFKVKEIHTNDFIINTPEKRGQAADSRITAIAYGEPIDLLKHDINITIKSPTYHNLNIKKQNSSGLWKATVIFDV